MSKKFFSWSTGFKSIIVVDNELFNNDYTIKLHLTPVTTELAEQGDYFERLKMLFENVFNNTVTVCKDEELYAILEKQTNNRFIQLPRPPYDQLMAAVCFTKANAVLKGKIIINELELSSYQGDGITYRIYTGHYRWHNHGADIETVDKEHNDHAKIFEFNPKVLDGDKGKDK